ncbi:peptidase S8/S53 domain-containing protein [Coniochaeta sp. 2T2.1]|nr:peptidase S8/S53 domain-containing protein [Coniochaeta sp. 2T2.1]
MALRSLTTRIQRVGILSLLSLVSSGIALILFAQNTGSSSAKNIRNQSTTDAGQGVFRIGSHLSVQTWLAILGATFAVLSHGLTGTYTHIFDSWCTLAAKKRPASLNYTRYLNSQPHAPTILGLYHGFPSLVILHYIFLALAIALSVGYKFAVIEVTYRAVEELPLAQIRLQPPPARAVVTTSPWITDAPMSEPNRAFVHHGLEYDDGVAALSPPRGVTMAGWANCSDAGFHPLDRGTLVTREVVMSATLEKEGFGGEGPYVMRKKEAAGWYRVPEPGTVQIQWAKRGNWLDDASGTQPGLAERRLTYRMRLAVAEMHRRVMNSSCEHIPGGSGDVLAVSERSITLRSAASSVVAGNQRFVAALLDVEGMGPRDGVSVILRGIMAGWGSQLADNGPPPLGHAPPHTEPFRKEEGTSTWICVEYPTKTKVRVAILDTGCDVAANCIVNLGDGEARLEGHWKDWVGASTLPIDDDPKQHGTLAVSLLLRVARHTEVFVARIARDQEGLKVATDNIVKAISYAAAEWDVDIVSMSFGFDVRILAVEKAISETITKRREAGRDILFFAAANNDGLNNDEMFPASDPNVISVSGTDHSGAFLQKYHPNPRPNKRGIPRFGTLAENVPYDCANEHSFRSGCSLATPILAGLIATVVQYVEHMGDDGLRHGVRTRDGILQVMNHMADSNDMSHKYIAPWKFFKRNGEGRIALIRSALDELQPCR